jgi:hypothetical protein
MAAQLREADAPLPGETPGESGDEDLDLSERPSEMLERDTQLLGNRNSKARKWMQKRFRAIAKGFQDQAERSNKLDQFWNTYHCLRDDNTYYNGEAQIYVPTIHDAVKALVTRYSNQLMPQPGRYIEATTTDGEQPYEIIALGNHYLKRAKFKSLVLKPLIRNGLIEGQLNLYLDWQEIHRHIVSRETRGVLTEGPQPGQQIESDAGTEIVEIKEEDLIEGRPLFEVLHDADVLVLPATADSIDEALECGGSVTIVRRFSPEGLKEMAKAEDLDLNVGHDDKGQPRTDRDYETSVVFAVESAEMTGLRDIEKSLARDVGIKTRGKHAILFEVWQKVPLTEKGNFSEGGEPRLCKSWYALSHEALSLKRNPHWNDRCPLLSEPIEKQSGVFKGKSQVEAVAELQYESNDAANERADVDHMSAMPIVMQQSEDANAPLLVAKGAIWNYTKTPPQFAVFPSLSDRGTARVQDARALIFQSLSVNPAMLPMAKGGSKQNQAEVAQQQQVDLLTTAEEVDVIDSLLTEMVERIIDYDHQYRDRDVTIQRFGELGVRAEMIDVPPFRNRAAIDFQWVGSVQMRMNVAMQQNGTAFINVARGMADQLKQEGLTLSLGTLLEYQCSSIFGPTIARKTLRDQRRELSMDAEIENEMLGDGHEVPVSMFDNDQQHLQSHQKAMRDSGDPHGTFRVHIQWHLKQMQMKNMAQQQAMMQSGGAPGVPGGAGPGVAGTPRPGPPRVAGPQPGGVPTQPRQMKAPPGRIPATALPRAGAIIPPRRF